MTPDQIKVSKAAVLQARACGLYGDTEKRVRGLAARATLTDHYAGNLAYGPFVLHMRRGEVLSITMTGPIEVDERPVSECKLCGGMMVRRITTTMNGAEGVASRPCPRAFDPSQPLCDLLVRRTTDD